MEMIMLAIGTVLGIIAGHLLTLFFYHPKHRYLCPEYIQVRDGWVCIGNKENCFIEEQIPKEKL